MTLVILSSLIAGLVLLIAALSRKMGGYSKENKRLKDENKRLKQMLHVAASPSLSPGELLKRMRDGGL